MICDICRQETNVLLNTGPLVLDDDGNVRQDDVPNHHPRGKALAVDRTALVCDKCDRLIREEQRKR